MIGMEKGNIELIVLAQPQHFIEVITSECYKCCGALFMYF